MIYQNTLPEQCKHCYCFNLPDSTLPLMMEYKHIIFGEFTTDIPELHQMQVSPVQLIVDIMKRKWRKYRNDIKTISL